MSPPRDPLERLKAHREARALRQRRRPPPGGWGERAGRDWRSLPLREDVARAAAHLIGWAGLGPCHLVPGADGDRAGGWLLLVEDPALPDAGLFVLATLGDLAPFLRRAWRRDGPPAGPTRFGGEAQAEARALLDAALPAPARRPRGAGRGPKG